MSDEIAKAIEEALELEPGTEPFKVFANYVVDVMAPPDALEEGYLRCLAGLIENYGARPGDVWTAKPSEMKQLEDKTFKREVRVELVRVAPKVEDRDVLVPAAPPSVIAEPEHPPEPNLDRGSYERNIMKFAKRALNHFNGLPKDPSEKAN